MSAAKISARKRSVPQSENPKPEKKMNKRLIEDDFDVHLSSEIKGIVSALQLIKEKAHQDGQKKNEQTISSVALDIKSSLDELKTKFEKDRQTLARALSKSSKECETLLKNETAKFQAIYENLCKEKAAHLQALKDTISKHEEEKEKLFVRYEQQRKKERNMIAEHEKSCTKKIAELEESLKKKKQDDKTFSILRKTLGSFLDNASDEDFPPEDELL